MKDEVITSGISMSYLLISSKMKKSDCDLCVDMMTENEMK